MIGADLALPSANGPVDSAFPVPIQARPSRVRTPISPGKPPLLTLLERLRHRVQAGSAARPAATDPEQRHPPAGPEPVAPDRLVAVLGTGGDMAAGVPDEARERQLIKTDEPHSRQPARGPAKRTLPVAGPPDSRRMRAAGSVAHVTRTPFEASWRRSGQARRPQHRMSAWSRHAAPCSPSRA